MFIKDIILVQKQKTFTYNLCTRKHQASGKDSGYGDDLSLKGK